MQVASAWCISVAEYTNNTLLSKRILKSLKYLDILNHKSYESAPSGYIIQ